MARVLIALIKLYRIVATPLRGRSRCLFAVSCSRHVENVVREKGVRAGIAAAGERFAACRPGYSFRIDGIGWSIECRNGTRIESLDASAILRGEYEIVTCSLDGRLPNVVIGAPHRALLGGGRIDVQSTVQ